MLDQSAFRSACALALWICAASTVPAVRLAQQPATQQKPAQPPGNRPATQPADQDQETAVRISTQLVQIDAVVTDKKGDHVENLTPDDLEMTVDGKRQTITYFKLVKLPEPKPTGPPTKETKPVIAPPNLPGKMIEPEQVKRTIAFVVDDLGLSFESTYFARRALKKFVDEQMQEGDLVGIIRTGRGLGALQQFTSDRRILYAAIEKLTFNPYSREMIPRFGAPDPDRSQESIDAENRFEDFRETVFSVGTLGALNFVVRGLRELPGRKVAILISDGFRLFGRERDNTQVLDNVRRLTDLANRSSVVIYSLDAKGLQTLSPSAADNLNNVTPQQLSNQISRASQENFDSQEGLSYLARETGGFAVLNNNDLNFGINKALHDAQSYYLLGFDPEDEKFDRKYHSIKLKTKREGLRVRTRSGFIGVADRPKNADLAAEVGGPAVDAPETRNRQILSALFSPFGARDLSMQMTSFFFNSVQAGSFVRSIYNLDVSKLTYTEDPEDKNRRLFKIDIASFTFNENGVIVDQHGRTFTMSLDEAQHRLALQKGMLYTDDFTIKKPGAYQFRTVLRDGATGKLGSAGQFIQVPDLTKKRLALSGLILSGVGAPGQPAESASADINPSPTIRRFSRDGAIDYGLAAYNAVFDQATGKPQLTIQIEIFRDGKSIFQGQPRPVETEGLIDGKVIQCQGRLKLTGFPPGDYVLRVIVADTLAKQKYARAEQWMDFSVR